MARDIDYAALAVRKAIVEKFWRIDLKDLESTAGENHIIIRHDGRQAAGTRDELLSALRKAAEYEDLWTLLGNSNRRSA